MSWVLIHGGAHGAWCWEPLRPLLTGEVLAVDLPGRGRRPGDLDKLETDDWAAAVVEDIESAGLERVLLVGHSLAGITMPRVAERIPDRIAHMIFVSCCIPDEGTTVMQALTPGMREIETSTREAGERALDPDVARAMFCNDMDEAQTRFVLEHLVPEAPGPMHEPVRLAGLRQAIPRTYIKLLRDASLAPSLQDRFIRNAGPDCAVRTLDVGHNAMVSAPAALGAILEEIRAAT